MGSFQEAIWAGDPSGLTKRERKGGAYRSYVPDLLADADLPLFEDAVFASARAQQAIASLEDEARILTNTEGIARLLLRAEALASSQIEGLVIGARRLLKVESAAGEGWAHDERAAEIIGNIRSMEKAIALAEEVRLIDVATMQMMHRELMAGTRLEGAGGEIRQEQNWIGASGGSPLAAQYVPPAPEHVPALLEDLCAYANREDVSPVVQAALVHAQFESIHPFIDGNGRTGRALIHLILKRRGACARYVPPISLVLATHAESYAAHLNALRTDDEPALVRAMSDWVEFFSMACAQAVRASHIYERRASELIGVWRKLAGTVRAGTLPERLLELLPGMPIFTAKQAAAAAGCGYEAIYPVLKRFCERGILKQVSAGKRNRVYEACGAIEIFNVLERGLASAVGDTLREKPSRPVPFRTDGTSVADAVLGSSGDIPPCDDAR